jgi:hypothetical protein
MTTQQLNDFNVGLAANKEDEFSIPNDISDIINICTEYSKLGWQIQKEVQNIMELGVEEAIKGNLVKKESLVHIKSFLKEITKNAYFGDAVSQATECIRLIEKYENNLKSEILN